MKFNTKSRTENALRNMIIGIGSQLIILLSSFISRTIFIQQLGAEYLGVNGLYSNILAVLSLAELGIGNVMVYSLYGPVAEKNEAKIYALLNFYKKTYRKIALVVFIIGICLIPLLDLITNGDLVFHKLVLYYILFLLNSIVSYFVAYKAALINVDQKIYIIQKLNTLFTLARDTFQITFLLITKSYILYLCIQIIFTILNNYFISLRADKLYPFIKKKIDIIKFDSSNIKENIKSVFIYRIGSVLMNNTDAILISAIIGTVSVGYYSNYNLIITTVIMFIGMLIQTLYSSIGNLNAEGNKQKSYEFFNALVLFFHGLSAFCSLTLFIVFNDFITIWLGESYLLGVDVVIAIVLNFYIQHIIAPVWIYRETMGLYNQIKYVMIIAAIINLILSLVLGIQWGFVGIIIATAISRILTTVWYEPRFLYRIKFNQPISNYWRKQIKYMLISVIATYITIMITKDMATSLSFIMAKIFIVFFIVTGTFGVSNYKSKEFKLLYGYFTKFIPNKFMSR
ncbi:lipopolysaccharide biosynthesis protein [Solibacillus silvestris]